MVESSLVFKNSVSIFSFHKLVYDKKNLLMMFEIISVFINRF
jgi:hypothetical protein